MERNLQQALAKLVGGKGAADGLGSMQLSP
jgi:hypothetical protein